jgi:hypothetical protein
MSDQNYQATFAQQNMMQPNMMMNDMPSQSNGQIQQANITIIGSKTKPGNCCCLISTIIAGSCLIFPLCFMCCTWWQKIVNPTYELTTEAYRDVGRFIELSPSINNLNLVVGDNAFNAEKARILFEMLSRSRITGFTFRNLVIECNG